MESPGPVAPGPLWSTSCSDTPDEGPSLATSVTFPGDGTAVLSIDDLGGVASYRVDVELLYTGHALRWSEEAAPNTPVVIELPLTAFVDATQTEWLTEVVLRVHARSADGSGRGLRRLPSLWVVWEDGETAPPTWVDDETRALVAPFRAWSVAAKASIPVLSLAEGALLEVDPPRSRP